MWQAIPENVSVNDNVMYLAWIDETEGAQSDLAPRDRTDGPSDLGFQCRVAGERVRTCVGPLGGKVKPFVARLRANRSYQLKITSLKHS